MKTLCLLAILAVAAPSVIEHGRFTQYETLNYYTGEKSTAYIDNSRINGYAHTTDTFGNKVTTIFIGGSGQSGICVKGWIHVAE